MLSLRVPVIVEGKYDKARVSQVVSAVIVTTDGFGIFNQTEKAALIRRLGQNGVILLCDSDGGGTVIRSFLKGILPPDRVYDLYIPQVRGKEKRKRQGGKAGFLGVEGIDNATLTALFERLTKCHPELLSSEVSDTEVSATTAPATSERSITKTDLYLAGFTGGEGAAEKRDRLCQHLGFPVGMTPNALLSALQILYTPMEFQTLCETVLA